MLKDVSGAAPKPAAIAEKSGNAALIKKYERFGPVTDLVDPAKKLDANGLDTHLVVGKGEAAVSVIGETKFANQTKKGGLQSVTYSGKETAGQISAIENATKNNHKQVVDNLLRAKATGKLDPVTADFLIEDARAGRVLTELVASGRHTGFTEPIVARYQASVTPNDVYPESAAHRQSLDLNEVIEPTKVKSVSPETVFKDVKKTFNPPKPKAPKAPKVKAGIITIVVAGLLLYDSLAVAETLGHDKGQVYVDFAASSVSGLAPTPDNLADTLFLVPILIEYLDHRRRALESVDPRWIASQELSADVAALNNLYSSTGETDPAAVPNLVHYDEGMVVTAPRFKQTRYK